jgi:hypothetical protein
MSTIKENIKIDGYDQMTPEQKVAALEAMQLPQPDLSGYISKDTFDKKVSELAASNRRVKELEGTKLTEEERLANDRKAFESEKAQFNRERNATNIKGKLGQVGMKPEEYAELEDVINSFDDADKADRFAESILKMAKAQRDAGDSAARDKLLGGQTPKGGTTPDAAMSFQQQYDAAKKSNDTMLMAKVIRKANEKGVFINTF